MKNLGCKNEYDFIKELDNKSFNKINFLLQDLILFLFPYIEDNTIINCFKNVDYEKGDICVRVGNIRKYISIKMGHKNSVHCESITKFVKFLTSLNVSNKIIKEILKYQYADGTIDNTGKIRQSSAEYKKDNYESIKLINQELNTEKILNAAINRFVVQGTQWHTHKIDVLVYGTPNDFFYVTPLEMHKFILKKKNVDSSAIHFSFLTFQPLSRVLDYNEKMEYMRNWIQIKWYNLEDNIIEMMNDRLNCNSCKTT